MEGVFGAMNELNILVDEWAIIQAGVDEAIYKRFDLKNQRELIPGLMLALKVELGELANTTRCFKHWSSKEAEDPAVILEEYADNMAFTISIGIISGFLIEMDTGQRLYYPIITARIEGREQEYKNHLTAQFNKVFKRIQELEGSGYEYIAFIKLFQELLNLAASLGFTLQDIDEAYRNKSNINHERQEAGY
jgi:dimeric dUTPase (all-alpha-NTP-PPase superfamily)